MEVQHHSDFKALYEMYSASQLAIIEKANSEVGPPSDFDKHGLLIQEVAGVTFIAGNMADLLGTVCVVQDFRSVGIPLVLVGAVLNFGAPYLFSIGHLLRGGSTTSNGSTDTQGNRCCSLTKEDLAKLFEYTSAYSCGIASMVESLATIAALEPSGAVVGKWSFIGASAFSGAAFLATLGEMIVSPGYSAHDVLTVDQKEPSTDVAVQIEPSAIQEEPTQDNSNTYALYVCKRVQSAGILLFSLAGLGDPIGSTVADFSPNSSGNASSHESEAGKWIITGSSVLSLAGVTLFVGANLVGRYFSPPNKVNNVKQD